MKIILTPIEDEHNGVTGEGKEFCHAAKSLIDEMICSYGIEALSGPALFEGLTKLAEGETEFSHWDMSCPEDAFRLKVIA